VLVVVGVSGWEANQPLGLSSIAQLIARKDATEMEESMKIP
jgi:hypothetical protein